MFLHVAMLTMIVTEQGGRRGSSVGETVAGVTIFWFIIAVIVVGIIVDVW